MSHKPYRAQHHFPRHKSLVSISRTTQAPPLPSVHSLSHIYLPHQQPPLKYLDSAPLLIDTETNKPSFPIPGSDPPLKLIFDTGSRTVLPQAQADQILDSAATEILETHFPFESGDLVPECATVFTAAGVEGFSLWMWKRSTSQQRFTWNVALQAIRGYKVYIDGVGRREADVVPLKAVRIYVDDPAAGDGSGRFLYGFIQFSD
ncbi:uncharacterized protein KY384_000398 [Bacidia gigantensis]|uniref:uncharacterized protein n=1 Tax=Bacidia gigantensis TaxID=2732470 RepID=UPI001D0416CD|nr:uncharacterized protein KY384_000398 [Bacidia gigantensis]KAG8525638.1 hypothetical protein KY384_000398 [Bacidia gigantensis]